MSQRPSSIKGPYLTKVICNWKSWHKKKVGLKHTWRRALAIIGLYTLSSKWPFDPPTVIATWFPMTCKLKEIVNYDFNPKDKSLKSSKTWELRRSTMSSNILHTASESVLKWSYRYEMKWVEVYLCTDHRQGLTLGRVNLSLNRIR